MKAIRWKFSQARYGLTYAMGRIKREAYYSGPFALTQLEDVPEPELVNENWVKIKTTYGGVCGSDMAMVFLDEARYNEPFVGYPMTLGHENVGRIVEVGDNVEGFSVGDRVVVDPMLPCAARDIDPPCVPCARGDFSQCLNMREGTLPPGFYTGWCGRVGGSWSECFIAHKSQLFKVPDGMTDEQALMLEGLAICVHAVMRNMPEGGQTVLVYGCGVIGMLITASLKALAPGCRVVVIARYPFQAEVARGYGADVVIMQREVKDLYGEVARITDAQVLKPLIGKRYLNGGPDLVFDCIGHRDTVDDALRMTRSGGTVVLVGLIKVPRGIDWTPIWFKELTVRGTLCSSTDTYQGETKRSFEWAVDLINDGKIKVDHLLTHVWELDEFAKMIETTESKGATSSIKQAFKF
jgi:threonine dehydrogenase-like Zn-dependent dehydrogenase